MSATIETLASGWWQWITTALYQGTIVVTAVFVLDVLLARRGFPRVRLMLWTLALVKFVLPPIVTSPFAIAFPTFGVSAGTTQANPLLAQDTSWHVPAFVVVLALAWLLTTLVVGGVVIRRCWNWNRRLLQGAVPIAGRHRKICSRAASKVGLRKIPPVFMSDAIACPAVVGLLRPVVILPNEVDDEFRSNDLDSALLHEFAHIKRADLWRSWFAQAVGVLFWFYFPFYLLRKHMNALSEMCCDGYVVGILGDRSDRYQQTLLRYARHVMSSDGALPQTGFVTTPALIVTRLRYLESRAWRHTRLGTIATGLAACAMVAFVLPHSARHAARLDGPELQPFIRQARANIAAATIGKRVSCLQLRASALLLAARTAQTQPESKKEDS